MKLKAGIGTVAMLGVLLTTGSALASDPAGVWIKVSKVVYEPSGASSPSRVQIHGAMLLWDDSTDGPYRGYTQPANGYLYYTCPEGETDTCLKEWKELAANAGAPIDQCKGIGSRALPTGSMRAPEVAPASPDVYPIAAGLGVGFNPCQVLADFLKPNTGAGGAGGNASGGSESTTAGGTSSAAGSANGGGVSGASTGGGTSGSGGSTSPGFGGASSASGGGKTSGGAQPNTGAAEPEEKTVSGCSFTVLGNGAGVPGWGVVMGLALTALARRRQRRS